MISEKIKWSRTIIYFDTLILKPSFFKAMVLVGKVFLHHKTKIVAFVSNGDKKEN
jgi:hypothetical protein